MAVIVSNAIRPAPVVLPQRSVSVVPSADAGDRRSQLQAAVDADEARAQAAAERGDLEVSARFILSALDGERRLASTGPQVLQVIKPRG